jgi:hypothetical protein
VQAPEEETLEEQRAPEEREGLSSKESEKEGDQQT